ncbi:hypothetical protein B0H15DRAFT_789674, partial [Mycena belliarum]
YEAHSKNLELYSGGFPPSSLVTVGGNEREVVQVTECSAVLALLLQYVHNQRQPDSSKFDFKTLDGLAEAAEKYLVYSAMEVCKLRMMWKHPLRVLAYATKHDYPELRDAAAPQTISTPLGEVSAVLRHMPHIFIAWVKYREGFIHAAQLSFKLPPVILHRGGLDTCELWPPFQQEIFNYLERDMKTSLDQFRKFPALIEGNIYRLSNCTHCATRARGWGRLVAERVNSLPHFRTFL